MKRVPLLILALAAALAQAVPAHACSERNEIHRNVEVYLHMSREHQKGRAEYQDLALECGDMIVGQMRVLKERDASGYVRMLREIDRHWPRETVGTSDLLSMLQSDWEAAELPRYREYRRSYFEAGQRTSDVAFWSGLVGMGISAALKPVRTTLYFRSFIALFGVSMGGATVAPWVVDQLENGAKPWQRIAPAPAEVCTHALSLDNDEEFDMATDQLYRELRQNVVASGVGLAASTIVALNWGGKVGATAAGISRLSLGRVNWAALLASVGAGWAAEVLTKKGISALESRTIQARLTAELVAAARAFHALSQRRAPAAELESAAESLVRAALRLSMLKRLPMIQAEREFDRRIAEAGAAYGDDPAKFRSERERHEEWLSSRMLQYVQKDAPQTEPAILKYLMREHLTGRGLTPLIPSEADRLRCGQRILVDGMPRCQDQITPGFRHAMFGVLEDFNRRVSEDVAAGRVRLESMDDGAKREVFLGFLEREQRDAERQLSHELLNGRVGDRPEVELLQAAALIRSARSSYAQLYATRVLVDRVRKTSLFVNDVRALSAPGGGR